MKGLAEGMWEIFLLAVSLALDAFAVSVSCGISVRGIRWHQALRLGVWFGFFQFAMPLLGAVLGGGMNAAMDSLGHWVAAGLLGFIGARMIWSAISSPCMAKAPPQLTVRTLAALALATSLDALAAGVSMAFLDVDILLSAGVIGAVAFALSTAGALLGRRLGCLFQRRAEIAGGLALIAIGIKLMVEFLYGG